MSGIRWRLDPNSRPFKALVALDNAIYPMSVREVGAQLLEAPPSQATYEALRRLRRLGLADGEFDENGMLRYTITDKGSTYLTTFRNRTLELAR